MGVKNTYKLPKGYWNPKIELMPKQKLRELQLKRLRHTIKYCWSNSPFYRKKMKNAGISPDDIKTFDDFSKKFPTTSRKELNDDQSSTPIFGTRLCVSEDKFMKYHQTSGTSGRPPVRALDSKRDWDWEIETLAMALYGFGIRPDDRAFVVFGYGTFIGFWCAHYAYEKIGCLTIPGGSLDTKARLKLIKELDITTLTATPSYLFRMISEGGDELKNFSINKIIVAAERASNVPEIKKLVEESFDAFMGEYMGMTEAGGAVAFECSEQPGGVHIIEDHFYEEVVDPETFEPVDYGEEGMRLMTPLCKETMPILRYITGDRVKKVEYDFCQCGRTFDIYEGGFLGRYDDMVKIRGILIAPEMIDEIVRKHAEIEEYYSVVEKINGLDSLVINIEPKKGITQKKISDVKNSIAEEIKLYLGLRPILKIVKPGELPRFELKGKRFQDLRK